MDDIRLVFLAIGAAIVAGKLFIDWRNRVKTRELMDSIKRTYR